MLFFLRRLHIDANRCEIKNKSFRQGLNSRPGDLCTILTNCTIDKKKFDQKNTEYYSYRTKLSIVIDHIIKNVET
jgi:hypothetical protein